MVETLMVSTALLWCLNIVLLLVVFALARQIGVLSDRVAPAGALTPKNGPKIGETVGPIEVRTLTGKPLTIGGERDAVLLTLFCISHLSNLPITGTCCEVSGTSRGITAGICQ